LFYCYIINSCCATRKWVEWNNRSLYPTRTTTTTISSGGQNCSSAICAKSVITNLLLLHAAAIIAQCAHDDPHSNTHAEHYKSIMTDFHNIIQKCRKPKRITGFFIRPNNNNNKEMLSLLDSLDLTWQRKREKKVEYMNIYYLLMIKERIVCACWALAHYKRQ
jgi:hypothetical protein